MKVKKVFAILFAAMTVLSLFAVAVGAAGEPSLDTSFVDTVKGQLVNFSPTTLGIILVAALGITVTLALAWFAYRFITRRVQKAMRKGSL